MKRGTLTFIAPAVAAPLTTALTAGARARRERQNAPVAAPAPSP